MTNASENLSNATLAAERKYGVELANQLNAPKTAAAIQDPNNCFKDIFKVATEEVGADQLVSSLLKSKHPAWAQQALASASDLSDNHRLVLAQKSQVLVGTASSVGLYLAGGAAFEAWFTLFWKNEPGGFVLPNAATPNRNDWKWSKRLSIAINRSATLAISDFAIANAPIVAGATCWIVVQIVAGGQYEQTDYSFTYQPDGPARIINTWGTVGKPNFCLQDYPNKGDCTF